MYLIYTFLNYRNVAIGNYKEEIEEIEQIDKALKTMKNNEAPGSGGISIELILEKYRNFLQIFTEYLKGTESIPDEWKHACRYNPDS